MLVGYSIRMYAIPTSRDEASQKKQPSLHCNVNMRMPLNEVEGGCGGSGVQNHCFLTIDITFGVCIAGLPGMAKFFRASSLEERTHAQMLMDFQVCHPHHRVLVFFPEALSLASICDSEPFVLVLFFTAPLIRLIPLIHGTGAPHTYVSYCLRSETISEFQDYL